MISIYYTVTKYLGIYFCVNIQIDKIQVEALIYLII
jgi:hypothetical protein